MHNTPENEVCTLTLVDDAGNKVIIRIHRDAAIAEWLDAFRKLLLFQQFSPENIVARLGD
jgi:hypothetical protein